MHRWRIPIVQIIKLVLLETGHINDQENSGEEASFTFVVAPIKPSLGRSG